MPPLRRKRKEGGRGLPTSLHSFYTRTSYFRLRFNVLKIFVLSEPQNVLNVFLLLFLKKFGLKLVVVMIFGYSVRDYRLLGSLVYVYTRYVR